MKTLIFIALLLACTMAVSMRKPSHATMQKIDNMKKSKNWAGIMMNLAELHLQSQGPLDQLVEAIESVIDDIERKTEKAHLDYEQATEQHNAEVSRINGQIDSANSDISRTTELLNNVLYVQKQQLESDLVQLDENIADANKHIEDETALRAQQAERFEVTIAEHQEALAAVREALQVLSQLFEDNTSLVQVKKAQKAISKVQDKIGNNVEGSLVKALLSLSTSQFSDQSDVQKVADLLTQVQNNLQNSIVEFTALEQQAIDEFNADMSTTQANINRWQLEITEKTELLAQTNESIEENEDFLAQRQRDLAEYQDDLVAENERFDQVTANYEDLVQQLEVEHQACMDALNVLNSGEIEGYIGNRMEQDVIIDQPHGMGITVEEDPFDLE